MKKVEKENKTTKEVVKSTKFANTIYSIRRDRNLTQKDLADLIGVSDRTISKWENGTTVPDLCQIRNICKKLEISPSLLIKSEKKFKDNMSFIKMKLGKVLNYLIHNIFLIGFIIAFILLLIYFINNFNSVKIYDLKYDGDNIYLNHGYFFQTKTVNILTLENIALKKVEYEPTEIKLELYTLVNGDKKILYKADNLKNIYIEENKSNTDLLSKDTIENIKRNLYLTIETRDEQNKVYKYECKLTFKEKFNNNKLTYKTYVKDSNYETSILSTDNLSLFNNSFTPFKIPTVTNNNSIVASSDYDTPEAKLAKLGYKYDEANNKYTKIDKDGRFTEYLNSTHKLVIYNKNELYTESIKYCSDTNKVTYSYSESSNKTENFIYDVPTNSLNCIKSSCKNYQVKINYILGIYRELKQTLQ